MLGKFSSVISSDIFSSPFSLSFPSGTSIMCILDYLMISHKSLKLSSLFFIFLFAPLMNSTALPLNLLILSSASSNLLLNPCNEFFNSVAVFLSSVISVWYIFIFLSLHWNYHFVHALLSWPSWAIFMTIILNSFIRYITYLHFIKISFWKFILLFCLEHSPLFLHFPWLLVLVSLYQIKHSSTL